MFPSPYGELHFSMRTAKQYQEHTSFRPLTGNYISQYHLPHLLYSLADLSQMRVKKNFKKCSLMESKKMLITPLSTGIAGNRCFFDYFDSASSHFQYFALISCAFQDVWWNSALKILTVSVYSWYSGFVKNSFYRSNSLASRKHWIHDGLAYKPASTP